MRAGGSNEAPASVERRWTIAEPPPTDCEYTTSSDPEGLTARSAGKAESAIRRGGAKVLPSSRDTAKSIPRILIWESGRGVSAQLR